MSDTLNPSPAVSQIILVALDDLRDPDWNPRPFLDEAEMPSLVDYIAAGRQVPPIEILKSPGQTGPWFVISGKRRCEAHRRAGRTHIEAIPRDVPLDEAKFMAIAANKDDKPFWLGEFIAVNNLKKGDRGEQKEFARKLGWTEKRVSHAFNLVDLLNPACRDLIFQSSGQKITIGNFPESQKGDDTAKWVFSEYIGTRLIPLLDEKAPEASQSKAEQAVRLVIDHQLTASQTYDLVTHILAGNDPAQFEPTAKVKKARSKSLKANSPLPPEMADKVVELPVPNNQAHLAPHATHQQAQPTPEASAIASPTASAVGDGDDEPGWFDKWLVGIKYITELRKKVKQGEKLTPTEALFALADKAYHFCKPGLKDIGRNLGKLFKDALKGIWNGIKKVFGKTFAKIMEWAVPILIICVLLWGAGKVYQLVVVNPWHWIEGKLRSGFHWGGSTPQDAPTPVPAPAPNANGLNHVPLAQPNHVARLVALQQAPAPKPSIIYQPAISFVPTASPLNSSPSRTQYDPKLFEQEIAAIPPNSVVKDYPLAPDETMPADLAVSRLQDLTDADRYTMMIGSDKQKILSFTPSNTNFILAYQNTDPLGIFGGGGPRQMNFFWEDVKYIHADEIDVETKTPTQFYQCSLVVSGSKNPLTIQCASADDLKNLVSTLEYFIRHSRLGHDAQPGGLPYPDWGVKLSNDGVITLLWADSPMDNAGVDVGGMIGSFDKDTENQPDRNKMEAALRALTPGSHALFVVSRDERAKARDTERSTTNGFFHPKRRKVVLVAS